MMHNLVADSADTSTVVCCCSNISRATIGGISPVCSLRAKWRWDRSVHFAENRPNPQRRVLLRSLLPHFWYTGDSSLTMGYFLERFDELTAQDASSWSRIQVSWSTLNCFLFVCVQLPVCACMCVVYVRQCVRAAPFDHSSAYRRHCMVYTLCNECTAVHYSMLSKSAESLSAWVVAFQLFAFYNFKRWNHLSTCITGWKQDLCNLAYSHYRCPLFSTYPTRTISATNVMNSLQFTECPLTGLDPCSRHDSKHAFTQTCNGICDDNVIAYVQVMRWLWITDIDLVVQQWSMKGDRQTWYACAFTCRITKCTFRIK